MCKIKKCTVIYIQCLILGTGMVSSSIATVTIGGLNCGVTYTITAGGRLGRELVGPISTFGTAMGNCSSEPTPTASIPPSKIRDTCIKTNIRSVKFYCSLIPFILYVYHIRTYQELIIYI